MNQMSNALLRAKLISSDNKVVSKDFTEINVEILNNYKATPKDIIEFNSLNPASNLSFHDNLEVNGKYSLVEISTGELLGNLRFDFKSEEEGVIVNSSKSHLTMSKFSELYSRASANFKLNLSFQSDSPALMAKRIRVKVLDITNIG